MTPTPVDGKIMLGLEGRWRNELGSILEITQTRMDGTFVGRYTSAVGNVSSSWYTAVGTWTPNTNLQSSYKEENKLTIGFSVSWNNERHGNSRSTTVWTGQIWGTFMHTFWVLTNQLDTKEELWNSTLIGTNVFRPDSSFN